MPLFCIIESTRRRRTSGGRSPATTAAERRHSNRSNPAGSNIQKKRYPSDISSFSHFFESTRRRRTSGGRSPATTAAERRHSNRSSPAGLEHRKKSHPSDDSFFYLFESTRRDSNSTNIGKATKIKEERTLSTVCLQAVYNLEIREESCQGVCGADTFYPFTACYRG